jgi:hypothetical protein
MTLSLAACKRLFTVWVHQSLSPAASGVHVANKGQPT